MKLKVFDVVELNNGYKATVIENNRESFKVQLVDEKGISQGTAQIQEKDIRKLIYAKWYNIVKQIVICFLGGKYYDRNFYNTTACNAFGN